MQSDPLAFVTTAAEFAVRSRESLAQQLAPSATAVTFGAFVEGELAGLLSLVRETRPTIAHRANIFGVSVRPQYRKCGCATALLRAALAQAQSWEGVTSLHLTVTETQTAARKLYRQHSFEVWGRQPDAVRHEGKLYAEDWMWRKV